MSAPQSQNAGKGKDEPGCNRLLAALHAPDYERLAPHLRCIDLPMGETLCGLGEKVHRVYFPTSGLTSVIVTDNKGKWVEAGVVASEGVVALLPLLAGEASLHHVNVQVEGSALVLPVSVFREEFARGGHFQKLLLLYAQMVFSQAGQSALCNVRHSVEQRFCRWMLTVADRVGADEFKMTQEFIAHMLGVRRSGVTVVADQMRDAGLLEYKRGHIKLLDRKGMEKTACECHGILRRQFDRLYCTAH